MAGNTVAETDQPSAADIKLVIAASSAGTIFEWYDFFIYGALGAILSKTFFPTGNATLEMLLFWLVFAVGFGFRPLGAILFGYLGDKLGRKYTFLVTVTLMGIATAGVGFVPSAETIGYAAPAIVIFLRVLQGLALGGEYGGAALYVSEHSPPEKRGFYTGFIQASVVGGFVLSLVVVLGCKGMMSKEAWNEWGWRVPFILSVLLLAVSLWMRVKLSESPVFKAMKSEGKLAGNPFVESFTYPGNKRRLFVALFGVAAGLSAIWYCAMFSGLNFMKTAMRMEDTTAEIITGLAALCGMGLYVLFGWVSDKVGRKKPLVWGYIAILLTLFPLYWMIGANANAGLAEARRTSPIVVAGPNCDYSVFSQEQKTPCAKMLADLSGLGLPYSRVDAPELLVTVGGAPLPIAEYKFEDKKARSAQLQEWLAKAGYKLEKTKPSFGSAFMIWLGLLLIMLLSAMTYGPVAALLTEMFPARIRYSSMSIPYHIGTGYVGGFLPFVSSLIVARTGDPYSGLWYTWIVTLIALAVAAWGLKGGLPEDFQEDGA